MKPFLNACRSEWVKTFTTRSWWILGLVMVLFIGFTAAALGLGIGVTLSPQAGSTELFSPTATVYSLGSAMGYVFPVLLGALSVTAEYRYHTITPTFLAVSRRADVLGAKVVVQGLLGLAFGVAAVASAVLGGVFFFVANGLPTALGDGATWLMFLRSVVVMGLWAQVGVALGALVRSQAGAIVLVLAFTQFIEPLARLGGAIFDSVASVTRFLPGSVSDAFVGESIYTMMSVEGSGNSGVLTWWQGGLVLVLYVAVLVCISWWTRWRSDVT